VDLGKTQTVTKKDKVIRTRDVVFEPTKFYEGPQGYDDESVIEEVIELLIEVLSFPEEFEPDDMAIEDSLTTRKRHQRQTADAPALSESQVRREEMEQYNDGMLTPEPLTPETRDGQNQNDSPSLD
jgi:hypothetical protein